MFCGGRKFQGLNIVKSSGNKVKKIDAHYFKSFQMDSVIQ